MYVLVECSGFSQLARIDPVLIKGIQKEMSGILLTREPVCSEGDRFLYQLPADMQQKASAHALTQLLAVLSSHRDDLQGFTVVADVCREGFPPRVLYKRLVRFLYTVKKDESMWVTQSAYQFLNAHLECLAGGEIHEVVSRFSAGPGVSVPLADCLGRPECEEAILAGLLSIHQESGAGYLVASGPDYSGKWYNTMGALKTLAGKNRGTSWLLLRDTSGGTSLYDPFLNAIDPSFLSVLDAYLTKDEKRLWDSKRRILETLSDSASVEDFYLAFKLYVQAYIKSKEEELLPPVMLCMGIDRFSQNAISILEKLFHEFIANTSLIPICVCRTLPERKDLLALPHITVSFTPEPFAELEKRLGSSSPENAPVQGIEKIDGLNIPMFHYLVLRGMGKPPQSVKSISQLAEEILRTLRPETRKVLQSVMLSDGLLTSDQLQAFLLGHGLDARSIALSLKDLSELGLVWEGERPICSLPEFFGSLERDKEAGVLFTEFAAYISEIWKSSRRLRGSLLLKFLGRYYQGQTFLEMYHDLAMLRLEGAVSSDMGALIKKGEEQLKEVKDSRMRERFSSVFHTCRLKYAILTENRDKAQDEYALLSGMDSCEDTYDAERFIEISRYHSGFGDFRSALSVTKKALLCIQQIGGEELEGSANIELGKIMLGMRKVDEAREYFGIAREVCRKTEPLRQYITASMFEALTDFLFGDLSLAAEHAEAARLLADTHQERDSELFLVFLLGRVRFSLGAYEAASCEFQRCLTICDLYSFDDREKVLLAWLGRSFAYSGYPERGMDILKNLKQDAEVLFFLSEASYFAGQYKRALHFVHEALNTEKEMIHIALKGDRIGWETGFQALEDRALKTQEGQGILFHLIRAFRGFLLGLNGSTEEGLAEISRLTREEKLSDIDPYNSLYYLFNTLVLPDREGSEDLDRLTLLSKALRYLQEFASRIRDPGHKQAFMRDNYWNRMLLDEARKDKLL